MKALFKKTGWSSALFLCLLLQISLGKAQTITEFSPHSITAGTESVITITGSGFGTTGPTNKRYVEFSNSDASGGFVQDKDATDYISWTDTEIKLKVPSGAGTGLFHVIILSNTIVSPQELIVSFNISRATSKLTNNNGTGGYTFNLNNDFDQNAMFKNGFLNSLNTWKCAIGMNWENGSTTANSGAARNNKNIISFDTDSDPLPAGVLAATYSYYSICGGQTDYNVVEIDMVVARPTKFNWNDDLVQSTTLHELGHGIGLGHVNDENDVMSAVAYNDFKSLGRADLDGGRYLIRQTQNSQGTCFPAMIALPLCNNYGGNIVYVSKTAPAGGDGTSWATAYNDPSVGIANAWPGDEVWVSQGTYTPTLVAGLGSSRTARDRTFLLKDSVAVYGGFLGTETNRNDRNPSQNETILSGDIGTVGNNSDNTYHVLVSINTSDATTLDGFIIEEGNANGTGSNIVSGLNGISRTNGGGIYMENSQLQLNNVTFRNNGANNFGGALYVGELSEVNATHSSFSNNSAQQGGAIYGVGIEGANSAIHLDGTTLNNNSASTLGGALFLSNDVSFELINSKFMNNLAGNSGGAIYTSQSFGQSGTGNADVINNIFYTNTTSGSTSTGGAITVDGAAMNSVNNTFYGNGSNSAGALSFVNNSKANVYNSIFFGNTSVTGNPDIVADGTSTVDLKNSLTQVSGSNGINGVVVGKNPDFVSVNPNMPDFLQLTVVQGNPAIDGGDKTLIPSYITTDIDGNPRVFGGNVDMGAFESQRVLPIVLVDFGAVAKEDYNNVIWQTSSENNSNYFLLKRSTDGVNFSDLAKISAAGNSSSKRDYNFRDNDITNEIVFYKLIQTDLDGRSLDYGTVSVRRELNTNFSIKAYPNPVSSVLHINTGSLHLNGIKIMNVSGQKVAERTINQQQSVHDIDMNALPTGTYFIQLLGRDGNKTIKVQKQ